MLKIKIDNKIPNINSKEERIVVFGNEEINWNLKRDLSQFLRNGLLKKGFIKKENMPTREAFEEIREIN